MNKKAIIHIIALPIVVGIAFYGGMTYSKNSTTSIAPRDQIRSGNGQFFGQGNFRGMRPLGGGQVSGDILSKDAAGIVVKAQDASTKLIFVGTSTQVMKSSSGTVGDLSEGIHVVVNGTPNADGSITAQFIQIRPEGGLRAPR